ncbi:MAG: outer membrane beta-barrel protein [Chitinophagaceae bacterium]
MNLLKSVIVNGFALSTLLLAYCPLHAQYHFSATAGVSVVSARLVNHADRNLPPYATGTTTSHWNFTPNYNLNIGYYQERAKGFQGISLGVGYNHYLQTFDADINYTKGNASSELSYLSFPVTARVGLGKLWKSYQMFAELGGNFAILQDYKEHAYTKNDVTGYDEASIHNNDATNHVSMLGNPDVSTRLNYWIYKKYDWGLLAALGVKRDLTRAFGMSLKAQFAFSLQKDIEEKGATTTSTPGQLYDFWDYYAPKGYINNSSNFSSRENTRLIVPGVTLAFTYTFNTAKHEKAK